MEVLYQQSENFAKLVEMVAIKGYDPNGHRFIFSSIPKLITFEEWMDNTAFKKIVKLQSSRDLSKI